MIRATARAGTHRRAGFRFGPEPVPFVDVEPRVFVALVEDPRLVVEMELEDGVFAAIPASLVTAARAVRAEPVSFADELRRVALAEGFIAGAIPGRGAGAEHPGSSHDIVPQPLADPNPALPAAGGTSDAGVPIAPAPEVPIHLADQPVSLAPSADELGGDEIQAPDGPALQPGEAEPRMTAEHSLVDAAAAKADGVTDASAVDSVGAGGPLAGNPVSAAGGEPVTAGEAVTGVDPVPAPVASKPRRRR